MHGLYLECTATGSHVRCVAQFATQSSRMAYAQTLSRLQQADMQQGMHGGEGPPRRLHPMLLTLSRMSSLSGTAC